MISKETYFSSIAGSVVALITSVQNMLSYYRMCSLTTERVLFTTGNVVALITSILLTRRLIVEFRLAVHKMRSGHPDGQLMSAVFCLSVSLSLQPLFVCMCIASAVLCLSVACVCSSLQPSFVVCLSVLPLFVCMCITAVGQQGPSLPCSTVRSPP